MQRQWLRDSGAVLALVSGVALVGWGSMPSRTLRSIVADPSVATNIRTETTAAAIVAEQHRAAASFVAAKAPSSTTDAVEGHDDDTDSAATTGDSDDQF